MLPSHFPETAWGKLTKKELCLSQLLFGAPISAQHWRAERSTPSIPEGTFGNEVGTEGCY